MQVIKKAMHSIISRLREYSTVDFLRKKGAIIGEDVELYNFKCSGKDATCLQIGNHVTLSGCHVLTHDASTKRFLGNGCNKIGRVVIGDEVFIGINSIIMPNVKIGNRVVIGAGSVVTHDIPDNSVAAGNPAKVLCTCDEFVHRHKEYMELDSTRIYKGLNRSNMTLEEIKKFNAEIDGQIAYITD